MHNNEFKENIRVVTEPLTRSELQIIAKERFGDMIKAVVDVSKNSMAIGAELHVDEEAVLLEQGSKQANLWGINLYPAVFGEQFVEFDSMVNIRPRQDNRSRNVESLEVREQIISVVKKLVSDYDAIAT